MKVNKYMKTSAHALTVTLIGAGGTGTLLLQHLARINKALIAMGRKGIIVTCIDDKLVSEANIGRQLFPMQDIGRFKCISIIERINRFYGTNWTAIPHKFDYDCIKLNSLPGNIIISCVDNV